MGSSALGILVLPVLKLLSWFYYFLPTRARRGCGNALGWILLKLEMRTRVVRENLQIAFPAAEEKRQRLFLDAYRHLGSLSLEILMLLGPMKRYCEKFSTIHGVEHWKAAKAQGRGVIMLASHVGNWEVMAATGALHAEIDIMLVTKHLKPEWLHQAIERGRLKCAVRATYEPRTFRDVLAHLKKNGTIGFVLDQYAGPPVGVRVPVFGVPVGTHMTVATLAKRTGATVLPSVNFRTPDGRMETHIFEPLTWEAHDDPAYELAANTARYAAILEKHILAHADQWLWIHRRFKGDLTPLREGEWKEGRARR
ncbi:MAG: lysophospholipid acyltransferase family protein [Methylotenera sp.]|nr:lysophospholipid acyltransferase family protein [Oligoflexia bacterium]